ncbi:serine protease [Deinococcus seoulensis]|uniref:Serine protease n=1 Tax=Deinococcus seoulensis TaxID=1837379 RepID=A0ABQ2RMK9_9DEIO|nr:S8 family serine peptidase [Deinococcus seoulensis]GGR44005.1 serine protease [Deinococcus seoulensis]
MSRHPASALLGLLGLTLLSACDVTFTPDMNPPDTGTTPVPTTPTTLADRTVPLAQAASATLNVPFSGTWSAVSIPAWLRLSQQAGSGNVAFTVTADRSLVTPLAADQQTLSAPLTLSWSSGTGSAARSGTVTWTVTAAQYSVTGRVTAPAQAQGNDIGTAAPPARTDTAPEARGVIVRYRATPDTLGIQGTPDTRQAQQTQQAQWQTVTRQVARTLSSAGLTGQAIRPLSSRSVAVQVSDVPAALAALRADPSVESVTPDVILRAQATAAPVTPTDQYAPLQWAYPLTGYGAVWRDMESGTYSKAVTVAVIDTGVRFDHPDLKGQLWQPGEGAMDLITSTGNGDGDGPDTDPTDPAVPGRSTGSHGTHVTGIIAARWGLNDASCAACSLTGVVGATRTANVKVLPVRVIDATGNATESDVALAIRYAAGLPVSVNGVMTRTPHAAQVINLSLGGATSAANAQEMCDAVQDATAAGSLVVAAAGNGYGTLPYYPAACPGAVAVASVTLSGGSAPVRSTFSNAYPQVQLAAPGGADPYTQGTFNGAALNGKPMPDMILSTSWDYQKNEPNYELEVGTSQASPQVAALAALLLSKGVTSDAAGTLARLNATATDLGAAGRDDQFGYGLINAAAALNAPAVSSGHGLRLQDARGRTYQPALDTLGRFQAWLGDGIYRAVAGEDLNGNGIYGETGERRDERSFTLSDTQPGVDLGDMQAR